MRRTFFLIAFAACSLLAGGCAKPPADEGGPKSTGTVNDAAAPRPQKLRLLVVDDPALAKKIGRLRGEWEAQAAAPLEVAEMTTAELSAAKTVAADAIVYPAAELGSLVERGFVQPLPAEWLNRPAYAKNDLFELVGLRETTWGGRIYAVPLGSPVMVLFYRPDLFKQFGREPPATWAEYQQSVEFFGHRENLTPKATGEQANKSPTSGATPPVAVARELPADWSGTLESLAPGWAGNVLLARAAAYAKHPDYYSTLFDRQTMEPRITAPPFVRGLEELAAAAHAAGDVKVQLQLTPGGVRDAFLSGHAAMALGWPTAADSTATDSTVATPTAANRTDSQPVPIGFVELPGSPELFNPRDKQWQRRNADTETHVPLLGIAGRMGSVVQKAAAHEPAATVASTPGSNAATEPAFDLLVWLSTKPWDRQICPASSATTLFRRSQMAEATGWVEASIGSAAARQYADVEARSCSRSQWVDAPRLPGQAEYMAALDEAVRRTVSGELTPQKALAAAADRWREITTRRGLDAQRDAYSHSLGLER